MAKLQTKSVARVVPALTARTQFGQILRRVKEHNERFVVDRRGEPQAVILGVEEYLRNFAGPPSGAIMALRREAKRRRLDRLSLGQINAVIARVRRERHGVD